MTDTFLTACVQNCASADVGASLDDSIALVREAARAGARLICVPEFFSCYYVDDTGLRVGRYAEDEHPALPAYRALARELAVWIVIGSLAVTADSGSGKLRNRSFLIGADGAVKARYDKIHMFDIEAASGRASRESDLFEPGSEAVLADTPWGLLGMTVCYDVRFPSLYRRLAQAGAHFFTVPAAFLRATGRAHWHVLLRSRAIETGCYVFAPCQYGEHGKSKTFGHSLIVDPWGEVVADAGDARGFAIAEIDPGRVAEVRRRLPALGHDRRYTVVGGASR